MKKLMTLLASLMVFCSFAWSQDNVMTVNVKLPRGVKITGTNASGEDPIVKNDDGSWTITYEGSNSREIKLSNADDCVYFIDGNDANGGQLRKADFYEYQIEISKDFVGSCSVEVCLKKDIIYFHEISYDFAVEAGENVYNQTSHDLGRFVKKGADVTLKSAPPSEDNESRSFYYLDGNDNEWKPFSRKDLEEGKVLKNVQNLVSGYLIQSDVSLTSNRPDSLFNITPKNVSNNKVGDESEHPYTYIYRGSQSIFVRTDFPESVKPVYMRSDEEKDGDEEEDEGEMLLGNIGSPFGDVVLYQKEKDPTYCRIDLPRDRNGSPLCEISTVSPTEHNDEIIEYYAPGNPEIPEFYYVKEGTEIRVRRYEWLNTVFNLYLNDYADEKIGEDNGTITVNGSVIILMSCEVKNPNWVYTGYVGCHNVKVEYTGHTYVGVTLNEDGNEVETEGWIALVDYTGNYSNCTIYGYVGDLTKVTVPSSLKDGSGGQDRLNVAKINIDGFNGTKIEELKFEDEYLRSWYDEPTLSGQITVNGALKEVVVPTYEMYRQSLEPSREGSEGRPTGTFGNAKIVLDPNNTETINDLILYQNGIEDRIPLYTLIGVADNAGLVVRRPFIGKDYHITAVGPMQANDNVLYFGLTGDKDVYYGDANFIQMTSLRGLCAGGKGNGLFEPYPGVNIGENVDMFGTSDDAFDVSIFEALDNISKVEDAGVEYDKENDILTAKVSNNTNIGDVATFVNSGISLAENINISLVEDIDLTESATPQTWSQLGTSENPFTGIFDGAGHSLNVGEIAGSLFGTIGHEAELGEEDPTFGIKDLSVIIGQSAADVNQGVDSDDMLEKYFGLLAQNNYGTISNVIASGLIYLANDEDAKNAVATLIANNEGVMDHVVGFFGTEEETANKASIIVIQNMGRGRTKGRVSKSASNGKAKGNATISYEPNEAEIKLNYRLYTDEEFAGGEPAYWLNFDGEGYSGNFNGEWAKGSKHPVKAVADGQGAAVRISYEVEGREENEVNVKGAFFANDKTGLKLDYDIKPDAIKINGSVVDSDPASGSAVVSLVSGARNNKGEMVVTLHYNATGVKDIEADKKNSVVKTLENGRVVIIRDGKKYDLAGRVVE
ncbi:MAG: hypothetical protein MJZ01_08605 [Bacteroidales bacterium]|nr:hypothetical protein [Bacteroidales bacterium]